jgi:predicted metal-dependent phosphotriesterase family hydrolase
MFILSLMNQGITREEIDIMVRKNPAKLLGLD